MRTHEVIWEQGGQALLFIKYDIKKHSRKTYSYRGLQSSMESERMREK